MDSVAETWGKRVRGLALAVVLGTLTAFNLPGIILPPRSASLSYNDSIDPLQQAVTQTRTFACCFRLYKIYHIEVKQSSSKISMTILVLCSFSITWPISKRLGGFGELGWSWQLCMRAGNTTEEGAGYQGMLHHIRYHTYRMT